jgi:hypothetical protein
MGLPAFKVQSAEGKSHSVGNRVVWNALLTHSLDSLHRMQASTVHYNKSVTHIYSKSSKMAHLFLKCNKEDYLSLSLSTPGCLDLNKSSRTSMPAPFISKQIVSQSQIVYLDRNIHLKADCITVTGSLFRQELQESIVIWNGVLCFWSVIKNIMTAYRKVGNYADHIHDWSRQTVRADRERSLPNREAFSIQCLHH